VQGSLLSPKDCKTADLRELNLSANDVLIIISQSCDVVFQSLEEEPYVEIHVARAIDSVNGAYSHRKHPRLFDFEETIDGEVCCFRCVDRERTRIPRRRLSKAAPKATLSAKNTQMLAKWTASRYTRPALPDEFNSRLRSSAEKISKLAKRNGKFLSGVYIGFLDESELPGEEPYQIFLLGSVEPDVAAGENLYHAAACFESIRAEINSIDGIDVLDAEVRSEDRISLDEVNHMYRMPFDYLSERSGDVTPSE